MKQIQTLQGPFWVWDQDQLGAVLAGQQFWDWQLRPVLDAAAASAPPGSWALDLGASIGWFTIYLAARFAQVLAVEMHPGTFAILERNVAEHSLTNVTTLCRAAYDRLAPLALAPPSWVGWPIPDDLNDTPNASSIALQPPGDPGAPAFVTGVAVDHLIPLDAHVACIKVDVQGCDLRALEGLRATITRCRPWIAFEYESGPALWHGDRWEDFEAFFAGLDYEVWHLDGGGDYGARPR